MEINPDRANPRVFEDIEIEPGRVFEPNNHRERWVFAAEAGKRAARTCAEFDAFKTIGDLTDVRHFTFRPRPEKPLPGEPRKLKAGLGDLGKELKRFAAAYDRWITKLVVERLIEPLLTAIHVRFDREMNLWDVHAHCIWRITSENMEDVQRGIQTKFSKIWYEKKPISNPAAIVNYITQWIIDHRALQCWPDQALKEVWELNKARFIRPAGPFAAFRRSLKGRSLERRGAQIVEVEKAPRRSAAPTPSAHSKINGILGYATLRLDRQKRRVAIRHRAQSQASESHFQWEARAGVGHRSEAQNPRSSVSPYYSTTNTGLTPPAAEVVQNASSTSEDLVSNSITVKPWRWRVWGAGKNSKPPRRSGIRLPVLIRAHIRRLERRPTRKSRSATAGSVDNPA